MSGNPFKPDDSSDSNESNHFKPVDSYGVGRPKESNWAFSNSSQDAQRERNLYSSSSSTEQKSWGYSLSSNNDPNSSKTTSSWAYSNSNSNSKGNESQNFYSRVSDPYGMGAESYLNSLKEEQQRSVLRNWADADTSWHFENVHGQMDHSARIDHVESSLYAVKPHSSYGCSSWAYSSSSTESSWAFSSTSSTSGSSERKEPEHSWSWTPVGEQSFGKLKRW